MYHKRNKGSHNEIGYHFGHTLAKNDFFLINNIPFPLTQEREAFALSCLPVYQQYFPEIVEEIEGLAKGQKVDATGFYTFLFSMYAMPPSCHCSCFAVRNQNGVLFGRNSDFLTMLEKQNLNVIYRFSNNSYNFTGNTTAFLQMEDGINEHGLAVGLTAIYPTSIKPGFNAGMLVRFFLERCKTTEEVLYMIRHLPIASAQTLTIADRKGDIVVIECNAENIAIHRPTTDNAYVCATNQFSLAGMTSFNVELDNWQADERYQTLVHTLEKHYQSFNIPLAEQLLSGKTGFMCQYDRSTGKDTVWSVIYDLSNCVIYRVEGNPSRKSFKQDTRFTKIKED